MLLLSPYERKARLIPGLLAIAPVTVSIAMLGLKQFPTATAILALLSATGGTYLLAVLVASFGRRAQDKLWKNWQGRPTTHLLRTREQTDNPAQRELWRKALARVTKVRLLTPAREAATSQEADNAIEAAVNLVLHLGQDDRFPILASENAQYGLERNLYGFRWVGRSVATVCILVLSITSNFTAWLTPELLYSGLAINVVILGLWIFLPSERRTKEAGFRYAKQLLNATMQIEPLRK